MKTKKTASLAILSTVTALVLLSPSVMAASSTPLTLNMQGIITNAGSQNWVLQGGDIQYGSFANIPLYPEPISYSVSANVNALGTSGSGSMAFAAGSLSVQASIVITGEIQAQGFPVSVIVDNTPICTQGCHSQVPLMFTGIAHITGAGKPFNLPIAIESAYWDPLGLPIVITSLDSQTNPTLFMVVTYNVATVNWARVQLQGVVTSGTFGSEAVSGAYTTTTNSIENLAAGVEQDSGQISFVGMSDPSLNAAGTLTGSTSFSMYPGFDCSAAAGLPPGTCWATGASSSGTFQMKGLHGVQIAGTYNTEWTVPSLGADTVVTASVTG